MKTLIWLVILSPFSSQAKNCFIETYQKIIYASPNKSSLGIIKKSSCPLSLQKKVIKQFFSSTGSLSSSLINSLDEVSFSNYKIQLRPKKIKLRKIESLLNEVLNLDQDRSLTTSQFLHGKSYIGLNKGEKLKVVCHHCEELGQKNISINIINKNGEKVYTHWLQAKLRTLKNILIAKVSLSAGTNLNSRDFMLKKIKTSHPESFVSDQKNMKFYRLSKSIQKNQGLKLTDMRPIQLITPGAPVDITLKNKHLNLKGKAISKQTGNINDLIQLKSLKGNKIIYGKVTGLNKAMVEL